MQGKLFIMAAMLAVSVAARADTVLNISGTLQSGNGFDGTITYSPDQGVLGGPTFTTVDLTLSTGAVIDIPVSSSPESGGRNLTLGYLEHGSTVDLFTNNDFPLPTGNTLCSLTYACGDDMSPGALDTSSISGDKVVSGAITGQASSVTPEASSFALFGTGLLGLAGLARKRFAR